MANETWEGVSEAIVRLAGARAYFQGAGTAVVVLRFCAHMLPAHVLVHRFVLAGGGRPGGPPTPPPCDEKLMRALVLLHVPPSAADAAAAAAEKFLALLPPPVRINKADCARLLLQLQVRIIMTLSLLTNNSSSRTLFSFIVRLRCILSQHNSHTILDGAGSEIGS